MILEIYLPCHKILISIMYSCVIYRKINFSELFLKTMVKLLYYLKLTSLPNIKKIKPQAIK